MIGLCNECSSLDWLRAGGSADGHGCWNSDMGTQLGAVVWGTHVASQLSIPVAVWPRAHQIFHPAHIPMLSPHQCNYF